jgi:hypothetical protein
MTKDKRTNKGLHNIIIEAFRFQIMKVEPTKVHLVSHTYMMRGFVSDGCF